MECKLHRVVLKYFPDYSSTHLQAAHFVLLTGSRGHTLKLTPLRCQTFQIFQSQGCLFIFQAIVCDVVA